MNGSSYKKFKISRVIFYDIMIRSPFFAFLFGRAGGKGWTKPVVLRRGKWFCPPLPPQGHLTISGDAFGCPACLGRSSGWVSDLWYTGQPPPPQQIILWAHVWMVLSYVRPPVTWTHWELSESQASSSRRRPHECLLSCNQLLSSWVLAQWVSTFLDSKSFSLSYQWSRWPPWGL